jgi:Ca2+-binding RTX toxin-like protein
MPTPSTYSPSFSASLTGNKIVDSLISGTYWLGSNWTPLGPTNLSYSFMAPNTSYFVTNYSPDNEYNALYALTSEQQSAVTSALSSWSAVANLNFTLTSDDITNVGDLRFGAYRLMDNQTAAWAYFPANNPSAGDVWIGPQTNDANPGHGSYDYMTFIHEIGHALGLKHPFDVSSTNKTLLDPLLDDVHFTVMSYNSNYSYQPTTPMVLDILAIQSLYGANMLWQAGDTIYKWAADQSIFETIWDAGGNDTIDASNQLAAVSLNLNEAAFSQIGQKFVDYNSLTAVNDGLAIAYGAKIENAIGSAFNDMLTGNALDNTLDGGLGADTLQGGLGNDTYYVDNLGDTVIETSTLAGEIDTVRSSVDFTLGGNLENLTLTGSAVVGIGNSLSNTLIGNDQDNTLRGGLGADTLQGGLGNDTYYVDNLGDTVIETSTLANEIDTVRSSVDFTLGGNLENLTLTGSAVVGIGNSLSNTLIGNDQDNTLRGGLGADTLQGGLGNDTYYVDNLGDTVIETSTLAGEIDTVRSAVDWTLGANLENLVLTLSAINGIGNSLNNSLTGNDSNNLLDGSLGADRMEGGLGNDTYIVDNLGDTVIETSTLAGEIDTVRSSVDFTLGGNLENLTLTGSAVVGIGNSLSNTLIGNDQDNTLRGGLGADTLQGGLGNDTYYVDNLGDTVIETSTLAGEIDTVRSSVDFTLGGNLENLTLTGSAVVGIGNSLSNTLIGNDQDNTLRGGLGADTLQGGLGNDTYYVDNLGDTVIETSTLAGEIDTVRSAVDWTLGANLENLVLTLSAINGTGNNLNNSLTGNDSNNLLDGSLGADRMEGGLGNDTYIVDNLGDTVIETSPLAGEIDTVRSSVDFTLGGNLENLTLTGSAVVGIGNSLSNTLIGNDQDNTLRGGLGADTLQGGLGNDTYYVDNLGDTVIETSTLAGEIDTVRSAVDWTLGANLENLVLTLSAINGIGNSLNNSLTGNDSNNLLDGSLGADRMEGGLGNDTYIVDNLGDTVIETSTLAGEIDTVRSSVDFTLGGNLENLTLTGSAVVGIGNSLSNTLIGNDQDNTLRGGLGADTLQGGLGNDTYYVDNLGDTVIETSTLANEIDTVRSSVDFTLGGNLENLTLTGSAVVGIGNSLSNTLIGNDQDNTLRGGLGADTLQGGLGNDTYYVDNLGDTVIETSTLAGEIDTVRSAVDWTLGANLDNLVLTLSAINGTGNSLNNSLTGNDNNNLLDGGQGNDTLIGGIGADTLTGGTGADTFVFNASNETGVGSLRDIITDFSSLQGDKIDLRTFDANLQQSGLNSFSFIGGNDFTGVGQLRFVDHVLSGNVSGNAGADFEIQLVGVNSFSTNDLVA